jgi:hypothetical protein
MGIKFLCPNGHKLNVKSFLSGKRAICPKCGARVTVPAEDDPTLADGAESESPGGESVSLESVTVSEPPAAAAEPSQSVTPQDDPFAEAPSAVWYVRPATGGQFGPASAEIMRSWVNEGRVGASSLVWRGGWSEWRAASAVFPQLAGLLAAPVVAVGPPQAVQPGPGPRTASDGPPPLDVVRPTDPSTPVGQGVQPLGLDGGSLADVAPGVRRRRQRRQRSMLVSALLVLLSIALLVILYFVWRRQSAPQEPTPADSSPSAEASAS